MTALSFLNPVAFADVLFDSRRRYRLMIAETHDQIESAQRLRYDVFYREMGARLRTNRLCLDADDFDQYCKHLIVIDELHGDVVGTYRILTPLGAHRAGRYYMEERFDITAWKSCAPLAVEVGRACVHRDVRNGTVIGMLWSGLAQFMWSHQLRYVFGSGSIPYRFAPSEALGAFQELAQRSKPAGNMRIEPKQPVIGQSNAAYTLRDAPALLRSYMQLGARVAGGPADDPSFKCIDVPIVLDMNELNPRFEKRFRGGVDIPRRPLASYGSVPA
jgi:putative hemolysin